MAGSPLALLAVCSIGFAVEFSWALLDGNIMPMLRALRVSFPTASMAFVGGPMAALLLQPALGRASDRRAAGSPWGKRKPFIAGLGAVNLLAVGVLALLCGVRVPAAGERP
eukprot:g1519.t1